MSNLTVVQIEEVIKAGRCKIFPVYLKPVGKTARRGAVARIAQLAYTSGHMYYIIEADNTISRYSRAGYMWYALSKEQATWPLSKLARMRDFVVAMLDDPSCPVAYMWALNEQDACERAAAYLQIAHPGITSDNLIATVYEG